jgi:hypothetical protein
MIFQWVFFLPIILPLCLLYGAIRGAMQMAERVLEQMMTDITQVKETEPSPSLLEQ